MGQPGLEQRRTNFSTKSLPEKRIVVISSDESSLKFSDYRPVFFDGRSIWIQEPSFEQLPTRALPSITTTQQFDERPVQQQTIWTSTTRVCDRADISNKFLIRIFFSANT